MALSYRPARIDAFARLISRLSCRALVWGRLAKAGASELEFADESVFGVSDRDLVGWAIRVTLVDPDLAPGARGSGAGATGSGARATGGRVTGPSALLALCLDSGAAAIPSSFLGPS